MEIFNRSEPDYNGWTQFCVYEKPDGWYWSPYDGEGPVMFEYGPFTKAQAETGEEFPTEVEDA